MSKTISDNEKHFCQGYCCAIANLISLHGNSTEAEDTYMENFLSISKLKSRNVSSYDIKILSPMIREIERKYQITK